MRIRSLVWKEPLLSKIIEKHGVSQDEVQDVVIRDRRMEIRKVREGRYILCGTATGGRKLIVVLDEEGFEGEFVVVTARDLSVAEMRSMRRKAKRKGRR